MLPSYCLHSILQWKGKYIHGAVSCEVHVRVYTDGSLNKYIVEANRVKGDVKPFFVFYKEFKSIMTKTPAVAKRGGALGCFLSPLPSQIVPDEQFLVGIKPIFSMARDRTMEARCEGVKMLCELTSHETHLLRLEECVHQVVRALETLVADEMEEVKQHAIMAVSNFVNLADIPAYKTLIIDNSSLLQHIIEFAEDAPVPAYSYDSIQARRECAHILFLLAEFNAGATLASLEQSVGAARVRQWMESVPFVTDIRLKNYMSSVIENLSRSKK
jgi:hypothetical protein